MLGLAECWEAQVFFHSRLHPSQYLLFFIWHDGKTERIPTFAKIQRFGGVVYDY